MALTFTQFGRKGNLGNQLFQYATLIGLSHKYNQSLYLPSWQWAQYFKRPNPSPHEGPADDIIPEAAFHYTPEYWDEKLGSIHNKKLIDINGWLQSEKYWSPEYTQYVLQALEFTDTLKSHVRNKYIMAFDKPTIAISIRRGDYVGNPNYAQLPVSYYYLALLKHFPDWRDYNILFFSDDLNYCRAHFECMPNAFFCEGNAIEQLCLGSMCDHFIIANSTFSWWMAYLGEKPISKIIRPNYLFAGKLLENHSDKDFWPERWISYDHKDQKLNMTDVTFTIPVTYDHPDRKQNIDLSICMLQQYTNTNIIVGEQGTDSFKYFDQWCTYIKYNYPAFLRTKMLNEMAIESTTPIIVNWDADMLIAPFQLWMAVEQVRKGADVAYPFDGRSARMPRRYFYKAERDMDIGQSFGGEQLLGVGGRDLPTSSVGHAVIFNKESFIQGGMENENMISYGPEDSERWHRFHILGYRVERTKGVIYHLDHWCGPDSSNKNPHFKKNHDERDKVAKMSQEELRAYVSTWSWVSQYTEAYYGTIAQEAIESATEVYKILEERVGMNIKTILDIGCGLGEWKYKNYRGIDYKVPKRALLIPEEDYVEMDLNNIGNYILHTGIRQTKHSLVLCLEVAEHLKLESAEFLIQLLCEESNYILFSAAIPYQPGRGHINCQWQSWWAQLFAKRGFYQFVDIREMIKDNQKIALWYRQNIVLYSKEILSNLITNQQGVTMEINNPVTDYVHPEMYENIIKSLIK